MKIKNIVFDIGNVLVKWAPFDVIKSVFPDSDPEGFFKAMYPVWIDLNLGKVSELEAIELYHQQLKFPKDKLVQLMYAFKTGQTPIPGSLELLEELSCLEGIELYSITDNIRELIAYHRANSNFLDKFKGVVVSADIAVLKPNAAIYNNLLTSYNLIPGECVFIDDLAINVDGARKVGMRAFQFLDAKQCRMELKALRINV